MTITAKTEQTGAIRQVVRIGAHTLHADVAAALGGNDSAPGPHDYFDASLAACKALTAHYFAKSRGYALETVEVQIERDDSRERQGTYGLRVSVSFAGGLSEEEKRKIYDVLERCPIHKLMTKTTVEIATAPFVP